MPVPVNRRFVLCDIGEKPANFIKRVASDFVSRRIIIGLAYIHYKEKRTPEQAGAR